jgi:hypothetical protein
VIVCNDCGRTQVSTTPATLDAIQRDLERDGDYEVVERSDAAGMLLLRGTETDTQAPRWMCAECLAKAEW